MKVFPLKDQMVVEPLSTDSVHIDDGGKGRDVPTVLYARVVSAGPEALYDSNEDGPGEFLTENVYKEGTVIAFPPNLAVPINVDNKQLLLVKSGVVYAIVDDYSDAEVIAPSGLILPGRDNNVSSIFSAKR